MSLPPKTTSSSIVRGIAAKVPGIEFVKSDHFKWDPDAKQVHYKELSAKSDIFSLYHEAGHAILGHTNYRFDFELLKMEVLAWSQAKKLAKEQGFDISQENIEKCIDSYRDWLHERSKCRKCDQSGLEKTTRVYSCFNCGFVWKVTPERFCRVYRKKIEP
jgi:hypothetical protein